MDRKQRLQQRLERAGIEQRQLARELELSEPTVSRVVNGRYWLRSPKSRTTRALVLERCAQLLGVALEEVEASVPQDTEEMKAAAAAADGGARALDRRTMAGRAHERRLEERRDDDRRSDERRAGERREVARAS